MTRFLAVDLGAESGRVMVGTLTDRGLSVEEALRFQNQAVRVLGSLFWDVLYLFDEVKLGLRKVQSNYGRECVSLGIDTWGCDYALLDQGGHLVGNPHSYRDPRTEGLMQEVDRYVSRRDVFRQSGGIQFLPINTLYQLFAMVRGGSPQLGAARYLLMMPDLFNYWLTGCRSCEYTDATTTQLYNSPAGDWSWELMEKVGIPSRLFGEIIMPGSVLGPLLPEIGEEAGLPGLPVVVVAGHDTASASVAVPADDADVAWLSSGTWTVVGTTVDHAVTNDAALEYNLSNYGGPEGKYLLTKDVMGLWLVQECRRLWAREGTDLSYDELTRMATAAKPFTALLNPDHPSFLAPGNMPQAICAYCARTDQAAPSTKGEIVRASLEGLALKYRWVLEKLQATVGRQFEVLHVVGGGSKNRLLCQLTADATGLPVLAGPSEATALGNVAIQAVTAGVLGSLTEARELIRGSSDLASYEPRQRCIWEDAYERFLRLL